jgi:hypothetical protein
MTQDTVRMQEMASNLKKNILTSLESLCRFAMLWQGVLRGVYPK